MLKIGYMLGDDIGLEVVPETVKVMRAAALEVGLDLDWREFPLGRKGHELHDRTPVSVYAVYSAGLRRGGAPSKGSRSILPHGSGISAIVHSFARKSCGMNGPSHVLTGRRRD